MRRLEALFITIVLLLIIALQIAEWARYDEIIKRHNDAQLCADIERRAHDEQIERLEKEIRILKTDIYILQNGWESE